MSATKVCKVCGVGIPRVVDSRQKLFYGQLTTRRRYQCQDCKARYLTVEIAFETADELEQVGIDFLTISRAMEDVIRRIKAVGRTLSDDTVVPLPKRETARRPVYRVERALRAFGEPPEAFTSSGRRK